MKVVTGDIVNDHTPVYVIEMTGGPFTAYRLLDIGVEPVAPDLTQFGPDVVDLTKQ